RSGHPRKCSRRARRSRRRHRYHDGADRSCAGAQPELRAWVVLQWPHQAHGRAAGSAIEHAETSLRLSPRARVGFPFVVIGQAHFVSRRYDEAVPNLLLAIQDDPTFPLPYRNLAACYAHMGRLDEARDVVRRLRTITPAVISPNSQLRNPEHRDLVLSGLRLAMGEET